MSNINKHNDFLGFNKALCKELTYESLIVHLLTGNHMDDLKIFLEANVIDVDQIIQDGIKTLYFVNIFTKKNLNMLKKTFIYCIISGLTKCKITKTCLKNFPDEWEDIIFKLYETITYTINNNKKEENNKKDTKNIKKYFDIAIFKLLHISDVSNANEAIKYFTKERCEESEFIQCINILTNEKYLLFMTIPTDVLYIYFTICEQFVSYISTADTEKFWNITVDLIFHDYFYSKKKRKQYRHFQRNLQGVQKSLTQQYKIKIDSKVIKNMSKLIDNKHQLPIIYEYKEDKVSKNLEAVENKKIKKTTQILI